MNCMNGIMNVLRNELTPVTNWAIDRMRDNEWINETALAKDAAPIILSRWLVMMVSSKIAGACIATSPALAVAALVVSIYAAVDFTKFASKAVGAGTRLGYGELGAAEFRASLGLGMGMSTLLNRIRHASWFPFA